MAGLPVNEGSQFYRRRRTVWAAFPHSHPPVWKNRKSHTGKTGETPLQNIFKNNLHREKFENVLKTGKPTTMEQGNKPTRTPRSSARQTEQEQRCWAAGQHEGGQTRGSNQIPEGKNHYGCTHPALGSWVMGSWNLKESLNVWQLWAQGSKIQVEAH